MNSWRPDTSEAIDDVDDITPPDWAYQVSAVLGANLGVPAEDILFASLDGEGNIVRKEENQPQAPPTSCPPMSGKMRNQFQARKTVQEALADCGDDEELRKAVKLAVECEEYKAGKAVPSELLAALSETGGGRSQSKCRFPGCGKPSVRTDRAKEHARVHIGNHPYSCTRVQADGKIGCGATFLRKHDRNRHDNGADILLCDDCGAKIQGKGREYNLQRHKTNYCPVRKATTTKESVAKSPDVQKKSQVNAKSLGLDTSQGHAPVPSTSALPMGE